MYLDIYVYDFHFNCFSFTPFEVCTAPSDNACQKFKLLLSWQRADTLLPLLLNVDARVDSIACDL